MSEACLHTLRRRAKAANQVIKIIASHGRRLLYSPVYDRTAHFGLDKHGQVWFVDDTTGMKLYPFGEGKWEGFTHGAAMQALIARLAQYIKSGYQLDLYWFPLQNDGAGWWAYGTEAMQAVRKAVVETGVVQKNGVRDALAA